MARQWRRMQILFDLLGGQVTKRSILIKGVVSFTLIAWWINPELATPVAVLGNFIWLWISPENETEFVRQEVAKAVDQVRQELDDLRRAIADNTKTKENA